LNTTFLYEAGLGGIYILYSFVLKEIEITNHFNGRNDSCCSNRDE